LVIFLEIKIDNNIVLFHYLSNSLVSKKINPVLESLKTIEMFF